ncbi:MAG: protein kinase domain-containing protein [Myxococcota bacterium]
MTPCLDENTLLELTEGLLAAELRPSVEQHLDSCESCRRLVAELARAETVAPPSNASPSSLPHVDPLLYLSSRELSRGGMGRIRLATDARLQRLVAIKEMLPGSSDSRRFLREARITARLQHPSIVKVHEAGTWPDGEPFFVMPFVQGRSLDKVLSDARSLDARLALLPHLLAVADALASAHAQRVIHRDLKPANILVGSFGETVVIDWGLARDLSAPPESDSLDGALPLSSDSTSPGTVVGTPAYMPPEQALGLPVDERADVYALGALLRQLLSGAPPFSGSSSEVLAQLKQGPPPPLRALVPDAPRDLVTIAERAMARAPDARFPSAREFADELRRFLTGQLVSSHHYSPRQLLLRFVARHRASLSVAAVSLLALLSLGALSLSRIVEERRLAEASRGEAESLLDFLLGDLHEKLLPLGRLELLSASAQQVISAYDEPLESLGEEERLRLARSHRQLGEVLDAQGRAAEAQDEHRTALAILSASARTDSTVKLEHAAAHVGLGTASLALGDATALAHFREALRLREEVLSTQPEDTTTRVLVSLSHERLGYLHHTLGRPAEAAEAYRAALAVLDAPPVVAVELAKAKVRLANVLVEFGKVDDALALLASSLELLARAPAEDLEVLAARALTRQRLGWTLLMNGQARRSLDEWEHARRLYRQLLVRDPSNGAWQAALAQTIDGVGDAQRAEGEPRRALGEYRDALALKKRTAAAAPLLVQRQRDVSITHDKLGETLEALGDLEGALVEYRASLEISQRLATQAPRNEELVRDLMISRLNVAGVLRETRAFDEATRLLEDAVTVARQLRAARPDIVAATDVSSALGELAMTHLARGDVARARTTAEEGLAALRDVDPSLIATELGDALERLATVCAAAGDRSAARRALTEALQVVDAALAQRTEDSALRRQRKTLEERRAALGR